MAVGCSGEGLRESIQDMLVMVLRVFLPRDLDTSLVNGFQIDPSPMKLRPTFLTYLRRGVSKVLHLPL